MNEKHQKTTSAKKQAANRRNALRSTGPRTAKGKAWSRRNALKHGILASALLFTAEDGEDATDFQELLTILTRGFAPDGTIEELWVAKTAMCWWRQKRALRCEFELVPTTFEDSHWGWEGHAKAELTERHSLVLGGQFDRVLRYQKAIQRELLFCLSELERLQRARKGKRAAASVDLHLPRVR